MKTAGPLLFLTTLSGVSCFVIVRDPSTILNVIGKAQTNVDKLSVSINTWTTDPGPMLDAANELISSINSGTEAVSKSANIDLNDAITLLKPADAFQQHSKTLYDALASKKQQVQSQGLCTAVESQISIVSTNGQGLVDAIVSKVPANAQGIARELAQGVVDLLNKAKTEFDDQHCVDA